MLGGYLAIILLIIIGKSFEIQNQKLKHRGLVWIYSVIIFSGLIVSFSRSAWLMFALGFGMLFWLQKDHRRELGKMLLIFIGTALLWLAVFSPLFLARTQSETRLEKKSVTDRVEYIVQAKEIIQEYFWLGVGAGNYTQAVYQKNPQKKIWEIQPVHNVFLLIWAELGIIGFLMWLGFLASIFMEGYRKNKTLTLMLCGSFFAISILDHWLWTSHFGLLLFFLLLGMIFREEKIEME
jgi:O-antigen ligase